MASSATSPPPSSQSNYGQIHNHDATETTPLLGVNEAVEPASDTSPTIEHPEAPTPQNPDLTDRPLPVRQILFLCYVRLVDPIAFFSIFPFINQMVADNGHIPPSSVGYYSGLIESLLSLTQMLTMIFWGKASDRYGRKPILVASLAGVSVACASFGFATSLWQMIVLRCVAGIFAGTQVTVRTMIQEHSTTATAARAFSWYGFAGNVGIFVGPLLGGALAEPAKQYGGWFKTVAFFNDFPYALSTIVTGLFAVSATLVAVLGIEETLKSKVEHRANENGLHVGNNGAAEPIKPPKTSVLSLLRSPGVFMVVVNQLCFMLLAFGYTAVAPVYWYTPQKIGGYGFREIEISLLMAATGASQAIWLLGAFPFLQRQFGSRGLMRLCGVGYPIFVVISPLLGLLRRYGNDDAQIAFWVFAPLLLTIGVGVSMAYTAVQLCLNQVAPSPETLGALNSTAMALVSGVRAFAPILFTSILAVGVKNQILDGQLVWVVFFVVACGLAVLTWRLPDQTDDRIGKHGETQI